MPELMEVEATRRWLDRHLVGRRIEDLELVDPRLWKAGEQDLVGRRVVGTDRRAKWLWIALDEGGLAVHLRMTGRFSSDEDGKLRARLSLDDDSRVCFLDTRCFAEWRRVEAFDVVLGELGPEPWPGVMPATWWRERLRGSRGAVKPALMKQERIAGLGNIAAIEICWLAELDPRAKVPAVSEAAWEWVGVACHEHLERALHDALRPSMRYLNDGADPGENAFFVYGRAGEPCPRCSTPIERFVQSGRGTFACPTCQNRSGRGYDL